MRSGSFLRFFIRLFKLALLVTCAIAVASIYYAYRPLSQTSPVVDLEIARGDTLHTVSQKVVNAGIEVSPVMLTWLGRITGHANRIKAGNYQIEQGINSLELLQLFSAGSKSYTEVAMIEGWNFRQLRAFLNTVPNLKHDIADLSDAQILEKLNIHASHPEGQFFPDTYFVTHGTSDLDVLKRAHEQLQQVLQQEWATREANLPYASPYEALIMASIVEKETGRPEDRDKIASVFVNRLRSDMMLQTDPTVIYGIGASFDGNLRKRDLQTDTPYNTYTRKGLPPTPIAMPGRAALRAALHPANTQYLYFVAKGNGQSYFSTSLDEHNQAVSRYLKNGK